MRKHVLITDDEAISDDERRKTLNALQMVVVNLLKDTGKISSQCALWLCDRLVDE